MRARGAVCALALAVGCGDGEPAPEVCRFRQPLDDASPPSIHTPRWAFEPWISKDISSTDDSYDFVDGFESREIPVGVLVLDSPWETNYNTFVPHPERYHDFATLLGDLRERDIRVVVWMTQMVNFSSFDFEVGGDSYPGQAENYQEGLDCGFYVDAGQGYGWWKGQGSALDFFHPEAAGWWHRQQDPLFDLGVAGFKLDFGDSYVRNDTVQTAAGSVPHQDYSEAYYRDFFAYGGVRAGLDEFVTMVRPYDRSYDFDGRFYARPEHAPVGWVGDNRRDWVGLADALDHLFRSARAGYAVIGSDIGGYLDRDDVVISETIAFDTEVFDRWTALGALTPFMQLHGRANIAPWTVPDTPEQTVALYRYWASLHHELVPFFYSLAEQAYAGGEPILRPIGAEDEWAGDFRYLLGEAFLVAPLLETGGVRDVALPAGGWYDWWDPAADALEGGVTVSDYDATDRQHIPLFVRRGAIIPLDDAGTVTGLGSDAARDLPTVLVYPDARTTSFALADDDGATTEIGASASGGAIEVTLSRTLRTTYLRIRSDVPPSAAGALDQHGSRAELDAADSGYWLDDATRSTWVKLAPSADPISIELSP